MNIIHTTFFVCIFSVFYSCSHENKSQQQNTFKDKNSSRLQISNTKLDSIIKCFFIAANQHGKSAHEAYQMLLENSKSNEIIITIYSIISKNGFENNKPAGWYECNGDTLLIYSSLDKAGIYDKDAYDIQNKLGKKLYPDSTEMLYRSKAWRIIVNGDSMVVYKSPRQWMPPAITQTIVFDVPKNK